MLLRLLLQWMTSVLAGDGQYVESVCGQFVPRFYSARMVAQYIHSKEQNKARKNKRNLAYVYINLCSPKFYKNVNYKVVISTRHL